MPHVEFIKTLLLAARMSFAKYEIDIETCHILPHTALQGLSLALVPTGLLQLKSGVCLLQVKDCEALQGMDEGLAEVSISIELTVEAPFSLSSQYRSPPKTAALLPAAEEMVGLSLHLQLLCSTAMSHLFIICS